MSDILRMLELFEMNHEFSPAAQRDIEEIIAAVRSANHQQAEAKVADVNAVALAWQEGYAQGHNDGLGCGHPLATRCNHNPGAEWVQSDTYDALLAAKAKGGGK